ncbi:MAG TPA: nitroreductase/quinone reductase family protein [Chloroflexota bacterium]|jgi:deazaflavin-dependent oxidoreductase (nitroreductase family)
MQGSTDAGVQVPPRGTHGAAFPKLPGPLARLINGTVFRIFRNRRFQDFNILALTTTGARSGQQRQSTVAYFPDGDGAWLIVASKGGAATHPAWFFNLAKHPEGVWAEIGSKKMKVRPVTLSGEERTAAWRRITQQSPQFGDYETKTDREIPVIRLTQEG